MMEVRLQVYNELSYIVFILTVSSDFYSGYGYIKRDSELWKSVLRMGIFFSTAFSNTYTCSS